jgi:hypothetical protein
VKRYCSRVSVEIGHWRPRAVEGRKKERKVVWMGEKKRYKES